MLFFFTPYAMSLPLLSPCSYCCCPCVPAPVLSWSLSLLSLLSPYHSWIVVSSSGQYLKSLLITKRRKKLTNNPRDVKQCLLGLLFVWFASFSSSPLIPSFCCHSVWSSGSVAILLLFCSCRHSPHKQLLMVVLGGPSVVL